MFRKSRHLTITAIAVSISLITFISMSCTADTLLEYHFVTIPYQPLAFGQLFWDGTSDYAGPGSSFTPLGGPRYDVSGMRLLALQVPVLQGRVDDPSGALYLAPGREVDLGSQRWYWHNPQPSGYWLGDWVLGAASDPVSTSAMLLFSLAALGVFGLRFRPVR